LVLLGAHIVPPARRVVPTPLLLVLLLLVLHLCRLLQRAKQAAAYPRLL
jgi:hypothetical protein